MAGMAALDRSRFRQVSRDTGSHPGGRNGCFVATQCTDDAHHRGDIRRPVDMYAVHWFQRLLVVMRHGESTGVARSQQSKLWSKHVHILGSQVDHDRSPRLAPVLTDKTAQSMRFSGHGMAAGTPPGGALAAATSGVPTGASAAVER